MNITALSFISMASALIVYAQSGGYILTEQDLRKRLPIEWALVIAQHPEAIPATAPANAAICEIDKADAARTRYLNTKESLYRSRRIRFATFAQVLAAGPSHLVTNELTPVIESLKSDIGSLEKSITLLEGGGDNPETLAEIAELRAEKRALEKLLQNAIGLQKDMVDSKFRPEEADLDRQSLAATFDQAATEADAMAQAAAIERDRWHAHHDRLRKRFGDKEQPNPQEGDTAPCVAKP